MKKLVSSFLAFLLCFNMCSAFAAEPGPDDAPPVSGEGSLSVLNMVDNKPVKGVRFSLYYVADQVDGEFKWTERFAEYRLELDPDAESFASLPANLSVYIGRDGVQADYTGVTEDGGIVSFTGLGSGLYLLTGESYRSGSYRYDVVPALVVLPYVEADGHDLIWHGNMEVKHTSHYIASGGGGGGYIPPKQETVSRHVLKTWDDIDNESERPGYVEVQLLKNNEVFSTVILNEANNWRHTWTELDKDAEWYVVENGVPEDYEVAIEQEGITFVVTNVFVEELTEEPNPPKEETPDTEITETEPPKDEPDVEPTPEPVPDETEKLPQTGQLWMPVFLCAGFGIVSIFVGLLGRRKAGDENE